MMFYVCLIYEDYITCIAADVHDFYSKNENEEIRANERR